MALTNIELYEALKRDISEESARMIAEIYPAAQDMPTKADIAHLEAATKADIARFEAATKADIAHLESSTKADIAHLESLIKSVKADLGKDLRDQLLRYMIPLWVAVFAAFTSMIGVVVVLLVGK